MIEKKTIEETFKEQLSWIKDQTIKEKVINVWHTAATQGEWSSLDDVPFTLLIANSGKLTDHTKRVTNLAKKISEQRDEDLNVDYLIAGALLHDVGKLLEYDHSGPEIVKSDFGTRFRHPVSGSKLAWLEGLPDEIVHIIYAHSHEGDKLPRTPESVIVNHSDFIDFHIKKALI